MNFFSLSLPVKIDFGWGITNSLSSRIKHFGDNALIFTGESALHESGILNNITDALRDADITYRIYKISSEPSAEAADRIAEELRAEGTENISVIVAIGGGSVIDAAKAAGALLSGQRPVQDFLGRQAEPLTGRMIPFIAVPSISGTGSETSNTALLGEKEYRKHVLRHDSLIPDLTLIDPSLTITVPHAIMLNSVMMCLSHLIEMYISTDASSMTDVLMTEGIRLVRANMRQALKGTGDPEVHDSLAYASMLSGIGTANASFASYSGITQAVSSLYDIPYGAISAALLYASTHVNIRKVQLFDPNSTATAKFAMIGAVLSGLDYDFEKHHVLLRAASQKLLDMRNEYSVPSLKDLGVSRDDFYKIATSVSQGSNPVELAETELTEILEMSY